MNGMHIQCTWWILIIIPVYDVYASSACSPHLVILHDDGNYPASWCEMVALADGFLLSHCDTRTPNPATHTDFASISRYLHVVLVLYSRAQSKLLCRFWDLRAIWQCWFFLFYSVLAHHWNRRTKNERRNELRAQIHHEAWNSHWAWHVVSPWQIKYHSDHMTMRDNQSITPTSNSMFSADEPWAFIHPIFTYALEQTVTCNAAQPFSCGCCCFFIVWYI